MTAVTEFKPIDGPSIDTSKAGGSGIYMEYFYIAHCELEGAIYCLSTPTPNISIIPRLVEEYKHARRVVSSFDRAAGQNGWTEKTFAQDDQETTDATPGITTPVAGRIVTSPFTLRYLCVESVRQTAGLLIRIRAGLAGHVDTNQIDEQTREAMDRILPEPGNPFEDPFLGRIETPERRWKA